MSVAVFIQGNLCWKELSLMLKEFSNDKGITKDMMAGKTQCKVRTNKGSDDMA